MRRESRGRSGDDLVKHRRWRKDRDRDRMRLLRGEEEKGVKNEQERLQGEGSAKEEGSRSRGMGEQGESVLPGVSRLSCRVVHHCVPGDCVCGLAPL